MNVGEVDQLFLCTGPSSGVRISVINGLLAALALGLASERLCQRPSVIFVGGLPAPAAGTLGISPIFNRYRFASPMLAEEFAAPPPGAWDIVSRQRLRVEA